MLRPSLLCSANPISQSPLPLSAPRCFLSSSKLDPCGYDSCSLPVHCSSSLLRYQRRNAIHILRTGTHDIVETCKSEHELVEVGFVSGVHGLQGEICVKPRTDFPELRFSKPGRRWLRQQVAGRNTIQEVELVEGRPHAGRNSWILKFRGIDSVDQVKLLVGSTLLADEDDRPELEEGEFYTRDLVGTRVILKETGQFVGTVVNIYNTGASDLLHVMLDSSMPNGSAASKSAKADQSGHLVWIPFVEAIVPDVDLSRREMQITPPKGLLEVNLRSSDRSKKERRQLDWKEKKKLQKRLIAAKKKLAELEQKHIFDGFRFGEKSQRNLLAEQIVGVNSQLLQLALQNIETSSKEWNTTEQIRITRNKPLGSAYKLSSQECLTWGGNRDKLGENFNLQQRGQSLLSKGTVGVCLTVNDSEKLDQGCFADHADLRSMMSASFSNVQALLCDNLKFLKGEDRALMPLVLVCPAHAVESLQKLFLDNDYFGFEPEKVWFCQEEMLPVVSSSVEEEKNHKILMKTPWEILQSPVGSGGVPTLLSSHGILEKLTDMKVDYIQICSTKARHSGLIPILLGLVDSKKSETGVLIPQEFGEPEQNINVLFSMNSMRKVAKEIKKLKFYAVQKLNSHVQKVDKEWIEALPSSPNSLELRASIYSCLDACSPDKISLMEVTD